VQLDALLAERAQIIKDIEQVAAQARSLFDSTHFVRNLLLFVTPDKEAYC
jgi:hypothetical protein